MKQEPNKLYKGSINKEKISNHPGSQAILRMADYMDNWDVSYSTGEYLEIPSYDKIVETEENKNWEKEAFKKYGEQFNSLTEDQKERLYYDQLFVDKFGLKAYESIPYYNQRKSYYEYILHKENDETIKKIYKNDPRLEEFLKLSPEYKKRLFDENIIPFNKEQTQEMDEVIYQIEALNQLIYSDNFNKTDYDLMLNTFGDYMDNNYLYRSELNGMYNGTIPISSGDTGRNVNVSYYKYEYLDNPQMNSRGNWYGDPKSEYVQKFNIGLNKIEENYKAGNQIIYDYKSNESIKEAEARNLEVREYYQSLSREDRIKLGEEILNMVTSPYMKVYGREKAEELGIINDALKLYAAENYIAEQTRSLYGEESNTPSFSLLRNISDAIDVQMQDALAEEEGFFDTLEKGTMQFINGLAADFALMAGSAYTYLIEGEDAYVDYITTGHGAYLQDVASIGSWDSKDVADYNNYGVSKSTPVWSWNQEHGWANAKTFYDAVQQSKWFVELAATEAITGGIGGVASKGFNTTSKAFKGAATAGRGYTTSKNIIKAIDYTTKPIKGAGVIAKHAAVAYPISLQEGVSAARETFNYITLDFETRADNYANEMTNDWISSNNDAIHDEALRLLNEDASLYNINPNDLKVENYIGDALINLKDNMYNTYYNSYKNDNIDKFNEAKYSSVSAAFKTTFLLSTVKTAVTNEAFRNWVFRSYPSYKYSTKELSSRMKLNPESGKLEKLPYKWHVRYQNYIKPFIHNPLTEGADELSDVLISSFGTGLGNEVYNKHYNGSHDNSFDTYMSYISSGLVASGNSLYEESTWREAWAGAFSGAVGVTPNIKGIVGVFRDKDSKGEKRTKLEKIGNIITNPILNDILSNKKQEAEAQRVIDIYNKALDSHQKTYDSMSNVSKAMANLERAQMLQNPTSIENARQEAAFSMMTLLEELESNDIIKDSQIVKNSLDMLEKASSGQISDEEAQEYINSLSEKERGVTSIEQAKESIQKKASELLKVREEILSIKKHLNSIPSFRELSMELQNTALHHEYNIRRWKREIEEDSAKLKIISKDSNSQIVGSKKALNAKIKSYEESIAALEKKLEELYNTEEESKKEKDYNKLLIKELKSSIAVLRSNMSKLKNKYNTLKDGDYADTITAEEMATLDAASLSYLLDEDNYNELSKEQLNEVERFKQEKNLSKDDISSIHKIKELQQALKISEKIQKTILSNPKTLNDYLKASDDRDTILNKQKLFSLIDSSLRDLEGKRILTNEQIIKEFYTYDPKILKEYIEEKKEILDKEEIESLETALRKANIIPEIRNLLKDLNITEHDKLELLDFILDALSSEDFNSTKDLYKKLREKYKTYNGHINYKVISDFLDLIDRIESNDKIKEQLETPIIPDSSEEQPTPPKPIEPEVKLTLEEEKKIEPEVPKVKPEDMQRGDTNPNAENELITFALNLASKGINGYTKETRDRVVGIINNASLYCTKEELSEYLLAEANRLDSQSSDENDSYASSLLRQCASKVANRKDPNESPQEGERRETLNIFEKNNSRASNIESLNMDQVVRDYPNSPNAKFYEKYKVREFLGSNQISNRTPVVFISDPSFVEEVEESMRSNGANPTVYSLPLVAAVEVESGGIEIDGKHYQPIAIMPATDSQTKRGASRLGDVRNRAYKQKDSGKVELVKDEEGDVITTTIYGNVNAEPPTQIKPEVPNKSAHTLLVNDASESDRRELQNLSKADRRKSPIYQRIKSAFLSKLSHRKTEKGEELVYNVPNLKGNEEIPIIALVTSSHKTVDRNSDELIIDLVKRGDKSALKSNSRIVRYTKALNKFFSETFNTSEFSFEQDDSGNVVPSESTKKALDNYAAQLDNILGNFLNLPSRSGWKYQIESTGRVVDGKIEYNLSIQDSYGNTINLSTLTEGKISEDTQLEVIRNLMVDSNTGEARMRDSKYGFVVWNVVFTDAGNNSEGAKNNMADIFDDDIIEFSKESLKYTIKGVTINAPFGTLGNPLYKKGNQRTTTSWSRTSENSYEVSTAGDKRFSAMVAKFNPGTIIEGVDVGGMTIEQVYQSVIKKSRKGQPPAKDSMINRPVTESQLSEEAKKDFYSDNKEDWSYRVGYLPLWQEWAKQNPELIEELREKSAGKVLTDKFANTRVSQARALAEILNSNQHSSSSLYTDSVDSVTTNQDSPTGVVNIEGTTIDADTGTVIGGNVQTEFVQEQSAEVESKPIEMPTPGKVRNRFEDSLDSKTTTKTVSPKYQWGVFEGAKMSVDKITDALFEQDILTEEDWNNLSEQEKDRILKCLGAL